MKRYASKTQQNKLRRIIAMPLKTLAKARDFYVRSMNNHAAKLCYGGGGLGASAYADLLPRSFSLTLIRSHENADIKEIVKTSSTDNNYGNMLDLRNSYGNEALHLRKDFRLVKLRGVPRSTSVGFGMAKIEEDKPCEFGDFGINILRVDDDRPTLKDKFWGFPRSTSCGSWTWK